tara:strand:- start:2845 stop:3162 length:318 start_codon:yes stop_codon:yes gene_type:complete
MNSKFLTATGELLDDSLLLDLGGMTQRCPVQVEVIIELVKIGVLTPHGRSPVGWWFNGHDLVRLQRALRLQRDLGINLPGLALRIELLEERDRLRARVRLQERRS